MKIDLNTIVSDYAQLLSVKDLARILGRSEQTIRSLRYQKRLPEPLAIPGLGLRWTPESIAGYIQSLLTPVSTN